jgi:general secretion pathway protein J
MRPPRRPSGFTLLELLVTLSLLSLVMVGMGAALRSLAQMEGRVDRRLAQADEMRVATGFLRAALSRISARKADTPSAGPQAYPFAGAADGIRWLGVMPARHGIAGVRHLRLRIEPAGLVLEHAARRGDAPPDWAGAGSLVLVAGATQLDIRYEDVRGEPSRWVDRWTAADALPQRVALSVATPAGPWPAVVATLRRLPGTDPDLAGRPVQGGK